MPACQYDYDDLEPLPVSQRHDMDFQQIFDEQIADDEAGYRLRNDSDTFHLSMADTTSHLSSTAPQTTPPTELMAVPSSASLAPRMSTFDPRVSLSATPTMVAARASTIPLRTSAAPHNTVSDSIVSPATAQTKPIAQVILSSHCTPASQLKSNHGSKFLWAPAKTKPTTKSMLGPRMPAGPEKANSGVALVDRKQREITVMFVTPEHLDQIQPGPISLADIAVLASGSEPRSEGVRILAAEFTAALGSNISSGTPQAVVAAQSPSGPPILLGAQSMTTTTPRSATDIEDIEEQKIITIVKLPRTPIVFDTTHLRLTPTQQARYDAFTAFHHEMEVVAALGPFELMRSDLPAEIRGLIYEFAFKVDVREDQNIRDFNIPIIAQVNGPVRRECLPLFFAKTAFYIEIASNLRDRKTHRLGLQNVNHTLHANVGRMAMTRHRIQHLRELDDIALFKDVTIKVRSTPILHSYSPANRFLVDWDVASHIRLRVRNGALQIDVEDGIDHPKHTNNLPAYLEWEQQDLDAAVDAVKLKAHAIVEQQEEFTGLTRRNIEAIAQQLRFVSTQ